MPILAPGVGRCLIALAVISLLVVVFDLIVLHFTEE